MLSDGLPSKALAAVLMSNGDIELQRFDIPAVDADDGLLKVEIAGVCQTDVKIASRQAPASLPLVLGHEILGHVAAIGANAAQRWGVQQDDRVLVGPIAPCHFCKACIAGSSRFCDQATGYGRTISVVQSPHLFGGYAEYLYLVPGSILHRVPGELSWQAALLAGVTVANAVQWVCVKGGVKLGDTVVIQGVGPIGLCCAAVARESGAQTVIVTGLPADEFALMRALEFGADMALDVEKKDVSAVVRQVTDGEMADVVIDTTGSPNALLLSVRLARAMGTVVVAGLSGKGTMTPLPIDEVLRKEVRIQGVFTFDSSSVDAALGLVTRNRWPFESLVTNRFALTETKQALSAAGRGEGWEQRLKVVIDPTMK